MKFLQLSVLTCLLLRFQVAFAQQTWSQDFSTADTKTYQSWKPETTAKVDGGVLHLLTGTAKEGNGILLEPTFKRSASMEANFEMRIGGADGAGMVILDAAQTQGSTDFQRFGEWDEPNLAGAVGIGFDTLNPPEKDPFNKNGNIDSQPEREVSVHWNDIERLNRRSETEYRASSPTEDFVPIRVRLDWVTGGANISVWVRGNPVYDSVFVPDIRPMDFRIGFGAKSEKASAYCDIRNFKITTGPPIPAAKPHVLVTAVSREPITLTSEHLVADTEFPKSNGKYGRIIAHLTLSEVSPAIDPWDRFGQVFIYDAKGERFELIHFMTSYSHPMDWAVDVTDFRPLLTGKKRIRIEAETYSAGWTVSLTFDFCPGPAPLYSYKVVNLWNGVVEIGNSQKPSSDFWKTLQLQRPKDADKAVIRIMASGHGSDANTDNAAEFMPSDRTLTVGTQQFKNTLWKTDVYLNPLRPQGGTWKYSRAGWAPGSIVDPWITDVSSILKPGESLPLKYEIAPYVNEHPGNGNPARYLFEGTAIFYRKHP